MACVTSGLLTTEDRINEAVAVAAERFAPNLFAEAIASLVPDPDVGAAIQADSAYRKDLETPHPRAASVPSALASRYHVGVIAN